MSPETEKVVRNAKKRSPETEKVVRNANSNEDICKLCSSNKQLEKELKESLPQPKRFNKSFKAYH